MPNDEQLYELARRLLGAVFKGNKLKTVQRPNKTGYVP